MSHAFPLDVCENCYYRRDGDNSAWFECRFQAPLPNSLPMTNTYQWPRVNLDDWCGDGIDFTTGVKYHKPAVDKT